jgi:hypothetical protein
MITADCLKSIASVLDDPVANVNVEFLYGLLEGVGLQKLIAL